PLTRRDWLTRNATAIGTTMAAVAVVRRFRRPVRPASKIEGIAIGPGHPRVATQGGDIDPTLWPTLAQRAVEAAHTAGAEYADARLTRVVRHNFMLEGNGIFTHDVETVGVGVRALFNGYWGFAASPFWTSDEVVRLARDAVAQAHEYAKGASRVVDMGSMPGITGTWATPIRIDPFAIPIEEKLDHIIFWKECAHNAGLVFYLDGAASVMHFVRQERVVATSDGSLVTQTVYESGGTFILQLRGSSQSSMIIAHGLDVAGIGWELFLDAKLPDQFPQLREELLQQRTIGTKPTMVGRYTLVCDGATMASLVGTTLGVATQLDRALGYEANAGGTSFITDPLAMVGQLQLASPLVTVTANRSAPAQLATVQWDDEGVIPPECTLITDGVLTDFQTTREQAAWLAPYYQQRGHPVRSNGCAAADHALSITMQHMPNLALEPSPSAIRLEDLVADVKDGILLEQGQTSQVDAQARNGMLHGKMRMIQNGRLGNFLTGGAVQFHTQDLFKKIAAIGGASTVMVRNQSPFQIDCTPDSKGQPLQTTGYGLRAAAALITNQPLISPARKA
ncbi:MAG TPA: TldD/PmbA family protein, partial [Gemmatimonadaceae bacterium]|nr:TldD/PmbA family protein [Gemmatimonadaceae bacterium]